MNFSTFATSIFQSQTNNPSSPLFQTSSSQLPSTHHHHHQHQHYRTRQTGRGVSNVVEEDILGDSYSEEPDEEEEEGSQLVVQGDPKGKEDSSRGGGGGYHAGSLGLSNVVVPSAFVNRSGGGGGGGGPSSGGGGFRGWKVHQSVQATQSQYKGYNLTDSDLSEEEEEEQDFEGPLPGTFVSKLDSSPPNLHEPLLTSRRKTLFVYPNERTTGGGGSGRILYRDSIWIVIYGFTIATTLILSFKAYFSTTTTTPPLSRSPSSPSEYPSLLATTPVFLILSLLSLFTSALALSLLLILRHTLRPLLTISMLIGPFMFTLIGFIAFLSSFGKRGVETDRGWRIGIDLFALGCIVMAWGLGRASLKRSKELNRAILVGELACQTIMHHPPLILLSLILSFVSTLVSFPFLALITSLLSLSPTHPKLAAYGSSFTLFTYVWTLAMLRGIGKATTAGVVGSWYFEGQRDMEEDEEVREGEEDLIGPSTVQITQAAFARAKGPSLGSILLSSLLTTLFQTLSSILRSTSRLLRNSSLKTSYFSPLTYLIPICDFLSGWTSWFNGYTVVYVGLTGKPAGESAKEVAQVLFSNRASNIRDTTLLRLLLTLTLSPLTLLPSLVSFLILSSNYLSPYSGGYAPMFAVLSIIVPAWTGRVVLGLVIDAVDTLFIATHLDAENQEKSCQKAVEASMRAKPEDRECAICGYSWPKPWIVRRHRENCQYFKPEAETEAEVSAFKEERGDLDPWKDMFTVIQGENGRELSECTMCDYVSPTGNKGKMVHVTRAKHLYRCPMRQGRKEENKPWLRKWNNDKKAFEKREEDFILPDAALKDVTGKKYVKTEFKPKARKTSPAPKKSVPKRAAPKKRTLPVGKRPVATKRRGRSTRKVTSSPDLSEEFQTSSDEESPPFSAGATSSEGSDGSEILPVERSRHSKSLVVKLKLSQEKLKSIVDKKVGHEVATDSDSEYQVPKQKNLRRVSKNGPTRANVVKASTDISSPPRQPTTAPSQNSSFFLERGYTPPRQSPRRSRSPTPSEDPHNDPGYFNEAFHVSSSDSNE
ncbi:hypothetical protein JCM5350_003871 [Sporobolomyces pararoseus]